MSVYVLDANIVSYYLKENEYVKKNMENALLTGDELIISPIAYYEVRRGLLAVGSEKRMLKFEQFCQMFAVGQLNNSILDTATEIYVELQKKGRLVGDDDIFIAAFCKYYGFVLVTNNVKHFDNISDLRIFDWAAV